jgi:magnesium chelatase family protein
VQEVEMMATVASATILGARGHPVTIEVHVPDNGLPGFTMLGLPDESCREARDRVRAAVESCGIKWPNKKIVVNLAPPQFRKVGSSLDIAIAVACLVAFEQLPPDAVRGRAFAGELGLDGRVRRVPGVAPMVGVRPDAEWVVPADCENEARVAGSGRVRGVSQLADLIGALAGTAGWPHPVHAVVDRDAADVEAVPDLADVRGQHQARLALEVAAAGGHHLLFVGSPGSGKTMLAERLAGLLPELDHDTALETTMIHSAAGVALPASGLITRPPFRSPHHTSSIGSLVGGGSHRLRPGEISLAHGGVLFLDELGQFVPRALDSLREAVETGRVLVGRVEQERVPMPARFQLVGATNPCPCGAGAPAECQCDDRVRQRYLARLSGPFLDRFDLRVAVQRPSVDEMLGGEPGESTTSVRQRVTRAREAALARAGALNAALDDAQLRALAPLEPEAEQLLRDELERGRLTGRGYHRVWRVARTIADLGGDVDGAVTAGHLAGALALRSDISERSPRVAA